MMKYKKIKSRFFVLAAAGLMLMTSLPAQGQEQLNSNYGGVQIGAITYSFRSIREVDAVLQACVDAGLSSVELMGTGVEAYLGAPESTVSRRRMRASDLTDEEKAAIEKYQKDIKVWRYSDETMDKYVAFKQKFNDAGVNIHIYKWTAGMSDEDLDYSFKVAKTLGAIGITTEIGEENCTKVGAAAERAGMVAIFHNHYQYADEDFDVDKLLALSPANRLNFDIGHYLGSTGKDPVAFIEKYHDQIARAVREFVKSIRDLLDRLFGRNLEEAETEGIDEPIEAPPRPFSTFADPFASGVAERYTNEQLIKYSFEAFEA